MGVGGLSSKEQASSMLGRGWTHKWKVEDFSQIICTVIAFSRNMRDRDQLQAHDYTICHC